MRLLDISKAVEGLALNELGGSFEVAYKLSWAGNANSGISFGVQQYDTKHNSIGFKTLLSFGVKQSDIEYIKKFNKKPGKGAFTTLKSTGAVTRVSEILRKHKKELKKMANDHIVETLDYLTKTIRIKDFQFENLKAIMQLVDYHNQFYVSKNGAMHKFLIANKNELITSVMIRDYKLSHTKWGKSKMGQNDIKRRFRNIEKVDYEVKISNVYELNDELFE